MKKTILILLLLVFVTGAYGLTPEEAKNIFGMETTGHENEVVGITNLRCFELVESSDETPNWNREAYFTGGTYYYKSKCITGIDPIVQYFVFETEEEAKENAWNSYYNSYPNGHLIEVGSTKYDGRYEDLASWRHKNIIFKVIMDRESTTKESYDLIKSYLVLYPAHYKYDREVAPDIPEEDPMDYYGTYEYVDTKSLSLEDAETKYGMEFADKTDIGVAITNFKNYEYVGEERFTGKYDYVEYQGVTHTYKWNKDGREINIDFYELKDDMETRRFYNSKSWGSKTDIMSHDVYYRTRYYNKTYSEYELIWKHNTKVVVMRWEKIREDVFKRDNELSRTYLALYPSQHGQYNYEMNQGVPEGVKLDYFDTTVDTSIEESEPVDTSAETDEEEKQEKTEEAKDEQNFFQNALEQFETYTKLFLANFAGEISDEELSEKLAEESGGTYTEKDETSGDTTVNDTGAQEVIDTVEEIQNESEQAKALASTTTVVMVKRAIENSDKTADYLRKLQRNLEDKNIDVREVVEVVTGDSSADVINAVEDTGKEITISDLRPEQQELVKDLNWNGKTTSKECMSHENCLEYEFCHRGVCNELQIEGIHYEKKEPNFVIVLWPADGQYDVHDLEPLQKTIVKNFARDLDLEDCQEQVEVVIMEAYFDDLYGRCDSLAKEYALESVQMNYPTIDQEKLIVMGIGKTAMPSGSAGVNCRRDTMPSIAYARWDEDEYKNVPIHEMGHTFGLMDQYCYNPPNNEKCPEDQPCDINPTDPDMDGDILASSLWGIRADSWAKILEYSEDSPYCLKRTGYGAKVEGNLYLGKRTYMAAQGVDTIYGWDVNERKHLNNHPLLQCS